MGPRGRRVFATVLALTALAWSFTASSAVADFSSRATQAPSATAVIAVWTSTPVANLGAAGGGGDPGDSLLRTVDAMGLSPGLLSTSQGGYDQRQTLLDISQGTRQATSLYDPRTVQPLLVEPSGAGATVGGWSEIRSRARRVSVTLRPGLLAASVPGGAAFVGVDGLTTAVAIAAADAAGRVATFSVGTAATVADRTASALGSNRLVVVSLPPSDDGRAALESLARDRRPGELLVVAHLPPTPPEGVLGRAPGRFYSLSAFGLSDGSATGAVTSDTTRRRGLVSTIDVAPTVLRHLGLRVPPEMRGEPIRSGHHQSAYDLESLRRRWSDVRAGRQASSLVTVVLLSVVVLLLLGTTRGVQAALRPVLRVGALAVMWWPVMVLLAARIAPARRFHEVMLIAGSCILAGLLTDGALAWPRGPVAPAVVTMIAYTADLATGGELLARSVLGPSILSGGRFYGVTNELEPLLPILLLVGLAAVAGSTANARRLAVLYGAAGVLLGAVVGSGQLGADVGGVLTIAGAFTVATLVVRRRRLTRRSVAVAMAVPVAGLGALIAVDLGLGGGAHLSRNLTRSQSATDLAELVIRRYQLMATTLTDASTVLWVVAALLAVSFALRNRELLYEPVRTAPWRAVLLGGLAAGVVGALTNDSGPVLLINSVIALAAVTAYVNGQGPVTERDIEPAVPGEAVALPAAPARGEDNRLPAGDPTPAWGDPAAAATTSPPAGRLN